VAFGKKTQNLFSTAKILGLALIIVVGLFSFVNFAPMPVTAASNLTSSTELGWGSFGLAMVFVLYTFGGWNDAAFVAAESKLQGIAKSLIIGTLGISIIYLLVNSAYIFGLGFERAKESQAVAAELLAWPFGQSGAV